MTFTRQSGAEQTEPRIMRVAFDQQVFMLQEYGGISRYVCNLATQLARISEVETAIIAPLHYNGYLGDLQGSLHQGLRVPRIPKTSRFICYLSRVLAQRAVRHFQPDIIHETYYSPVDFWPKGSRRVITVYDMISEHFPSMFSSSYLTDAKKAAVSRADHVLCISESTRRDLIEIFNVHSDKVSVVYLGYDDLSGSVGSRQDDISLINTDSYLLYVGSRGGYKNFNSLLRVFSNSIYLRDNFSIICFGGGSFTDEELSLINGLNLTDKAKQINGSDNILGKLYQNAAAFIYPSLYEGFGIPVLEAMSFGCPVICSNTSSIPEVVGDAGEYFDPVNQESMRSALENVLESRARRDELVSKGYVRCSMFSWSRCANETFAIYRNLI